MNLDKCFARSRLTTNHSNTFGRDQPIYELAWRRMRGIAEKSENLGDINFSFGRLRPIAVRGAVFLGAYCRRRVGIGLVRRIVVELVAR